MLIRTSGSAPAAAATAGAVAPWRALFLQHLEQMPTPVCAISTVHPVESTSSEGARAAALVPRARHCVFRGFWAGLPANPRNPAPRNPPLYETDLPAFTTDARMAKAWELCGQAEHDGLAALGSGGGPVEAVWWASAVGTQWRVRGTAWLLGSDADEPGGAAARAAIGGRMRRVADASDHSEHVASSSNSDGWSWEREVTAHFGNVAPAMRGSFANPPPGTPRPRDDEPGGGRGRLGHPVDDSHLDDPAARANFRVVVIVPEQVDQTDLARSTDPRRWLHTYTDGRWETVEVWP